MRKVSIFSIVCLATLLAGCGKSENGDTPSPTTSNSAINSTSCVSMLPSIDEGFPDGEITTIISDSADEYCVQLKGYKDGEYEKYIESCKAKGFTDVLCDSYEDTTNDFEAYTEDGKYYASLQLYKGDKQVLTISCGKLDETSD